MLKESHTAYNCDSDAVDQTARELGRGTLVVFSDGKPETCDSGYAVGHHHRELREIVANVTRSGNIILHAVGLAGHTTERLYGKNGLSTNTDSDIAGTLAKLYARIK